MGAAPQGPAGTGKTETAIDFYKHLGVYHVRINCDENLTADAISQIAKGVQGSGCFIAYDEFNLLS
jgi:dynein heavy chain